MKKSARALFLCAFILLAACAESGPRETLNLMAKALEENNAEAFLAQINMPVFTENYVRSFTSNDTALNSLNSLGDLLGLGSLDSLISSIVDFRSHLRNNFIRGVTTGELMAQCKTATTPDCPWYPSSLREAQIIELGGNAAIARVTTPARLTSWIILAKGEKGWQVVGEAVMEGEAKKLAASALEKQSAPAQGGSPSPAPKQAQDPSKAVNI